MQDLMPTITTPDNVFHDGNPATGEMGTIVSAEWLNNTQGAIRDIQAECIAVLADAGLKPDPAKKQLLDAIKAIVGNEVPTASTTQAGIVKLSSKTDSDSETEAATPKAVKAAMDATGKLSKSLGTAAFCDVTTSRNDNTLGRVLKVGDRNLGVTVIPASRGFNFNSYEFAAGETLFIEVNAAINFPAGMSELANTFVYVNVIGIRDSGNDCALLLSRYDTNISYLAWRIHEANTSINWRVLKIPTAAADIGALPITGGNLQGQLSFSLSQPRNSANNLIYNGDDKGILACGYGYYQGRFDIHFYDEKGAWASNPVAIWPNGNCQFGNVFDNGQRVYSPNNPQPIDLSGYATQNWVLQNFLQSIDLTAPAEVGFWDGRGYPRATDGAAMYNFNMVGGSSNVGNFIIRYTRRLVNNVWYVLN